MLTTTKLIFGAIGYALCKNINKVDNSSLVKNANHNEDYERLAKENKELKETADNLQLQVNAANIQLENNKKYSIERISKLEEDVNAFKSRNDVLAAQIDAMKSEKDVTNFVEDNECKRSMESCVKENKPYVEPPTGTRRHSSFWC